MSTERERFEETRAIAQAFINRLSRIANKREYDYLKPLFDKKTYDPDELEFLQGEISGSLWNYTFSRLSQSYLDLRVTREPTSRNKKGSKELIRLRVSGEPIVMPFGIEDVDAFISDLERIV